MLLDLTDSAVRIHPEDFVGELVVKAVTLNPLDEPAYLIYDKDDEAAPVTLSANLVPLNDPEEDATAHTAYVRIPTTVQVISVVSYFPPTGVYNCYALEVYRDEDDNSLWVAVASEDDLDDNEVGSVDGSYESYRDDWQGRVNSYTPNRHYASTHIRFLGDP